MKSIILSFFTVLNYIFIISVLISNILWKIEIGNDPLLWLLFLIYIITIINSLIVISLASRKIIININKYYIYWTILTFILSSIFL